MPHIKHFYPTDFSFNSVEGSNRAKHNNTIIIYLKKAIPLQALAGSEGSRRLSLPDFKTIGT
jgi:hypothetical protein